MGGAGWHLDEVSCLRRGLDEERVVCLNIPRPLLAIRDAISWLS